MKVAMADGTAILSNEICRQLTWNMQGEEFRANFKDLMMEFTVNGRTFVVERSYYSSN